MDFIMVTLTCQLNYLLLNKSFIKRLVDNVYIRI